MLDFGDRHFVDAQDELQAYGISLIETVWKLHSKGNILHCDLKPDNVTWNGTNVTLLDFGHAQKVGEVSPVPGTSGFEAPEVTQGLANTYLTDAFSVGKTLLKVLDRCAVTDEILQAVAQGLCVPQWKHRTSLKDAHRELLEHQRCQISRVSKRSKTRDANSRAIPSSNAHASSQSIVV